MQFFVLRSPDPDHDDAVTDFLQADGFRVGDAPHCPVCGGAVAMRRLLPPIRVELESWGAHWGDFAFGPGDGLLVSERLANLIVQEGIVGLEDIVRVHIASLRRRKRVSGQPPAYSFASVKRGRAAIDEVASGLVRDEPARCEECRLGGSMDGFQRVILEPNTWSGEDVFIARGLPGSILVTDRFKHLCDEHRVRGALFVPGEECRWSAHPNEP